MGRWEDRVIGALPLAAPARFDSDVMATQECPRIMDEGGEQMPPHAKDQWCSFWPTSGVPDGAAATVDVMPQWESHCQQEGCEEEVVEWKASMEEAYATLREMEETVVRVRSQLDDASSEHLRLPTSAAAEELLNLQGREKDLLASVQEVRHRLHEIRNDVVLPPALLYRSRHLMWSSGLLIEALDVLLAELEHIMKGECDSPPPIQSYVSDAPLCPSSS